MKKVLIIIGFSILTFSACGHSDSDVQEITTTETVKIKRFENEKIMRKVGPVDFSVKQKAKYAEERTLTYLGYDHLNIYERYGLEFGRDRNQLLEDFPSIKDRDFDYSDFAPSIRMSHFLTNEVYGENFEYRDPSQKSVMGVSYNTREGYLRSAKMDSNYPKGYIESVEENKKKERVSSSSVDMVSGSSVSGSSSQIVGSSSTGQSSSSYKHVSLDSSDSPKGYIEAYYEKYGKYPGRNQYSAVSNGSSSSGRIISGVDYDNLEPVGYLANVNNENVERPRNYIEATGGGSHPLGYIEATGGDGTHPLGFIEATGGDGTHPSGFIEATGGGRHPLGYIEATGGASSQPLNFLQSMEGKEFTYPKNYLDSVSGDYHRSGGFLDSVGNDYVHSSYGYIENSGDNVYRPGSYLDNVEGVERQSGYIENVCSLEEGKRVCPERNDSYLGNTKNTSSPTGYLENTNVSGAPKGYIETNSVYSGRPFMGYYGF